MRGKVANRKAAGGNRPPARSVRVPEKQKRVKGKAPAQQARLVAAKAKAAAAKERERLAKEKARAAKAKAAVERDRLAKEKARERAQAAKERDRLAKEKSRERTQAAKERDRLAKEKSRERTQAAKERDRLAKEKSRERAQAAKERDRLAKEKLKVKERERLEREAAQQARQQQQAKEREAAKQAREVERQQEAAARVAARDAAKKAREDERLRLQEERDRQREDERRIRDEERARKDKEREEFRKAKLAERERLRAERDAARRVLEGKIARASRQAQRSGGLGGRGGTARLYRASAIPDQSGTTRRIEISLAEQHAEALRAAPLPPPEAVDVEFEEPEPETPRSAEVVTTTEPTTSPPVDAASGPSPTGGDTPSSPPGTLPAPDNVAARYASITDRLTRTDDEFQRAYRESFEMSWIYHDSAMEGVVYTFQELKTAIDPNISVVPDSSLQPVCEEIRRHKAAIDYVRDLAEKKRTAITVDTIRKIYLILHPEEGDLKSVKYRKDIPQHRLYFHEYAAPDKITYKVRQVVDWLNGPEPKKIRHPVRIAARMHFDLVRVFPFAVDSGKVARLLMNLLLMRSDYPPAIIHSTERQRYYEALKGALPVIVQMVNEAIENGLQSIEKKLDEQETRKRSFGT